MFRTALGLASRCLVRASFQPHVASTLPVRASAPIRHFTVLQRPLIFSQNPQLSLPALFQSKENVPVQVQQSRTVIKHSIQSGKRKTVKLILKKFYRLHWGIWIRCKVRRGKRLYRKSYRRRRESANHVFLSATRSTMMDRMVCHFWKKPKFYVDDPYEPYHVREEYPMTRKKPAPAHPPLAVE